MRDAGLQRLIDALDHGLLARPRGTGTHHAGRKVIRTLNDSIGSPASVSSQRLPVCSHLPAALAAAAAVSEPLAELAAAFAQLEAQVCWSRRRNADPADAGFFNGHANATLIGAQGLELRDDAWLGVTLMAPHVRYPDHDHPPEEVYLSLTAGEWWNAAMDWTEPGPGGTIYNPPGIRHAMRSGEEPFLAFWLLPIG